ncbi:fumarylacetoacetate hydrolase family protein [Conexibacter sp. JD483]|uniref:fumarylacetoacetate hydrolase family protein n=1 Tax=unclassified Conexibacter TaxID=2627773 RepID=UPI0027237B64|nr:MULTISPECIES: fumarylacetoacetate hydrolase family protein [unclassified Conexibacter]MDO8189449.1 fumarylacetoacetate hydrolase family protein [Conexibacter sp. CPCC 205706]MDO8202036.1 fumarylacetoacetate hydrolase family protein [Conexibacter sp. CPCC 205762]MDR9372606.1 fumarylacetoacetate hydrolase family protein [Conexibacter sp. JD483]
MRLANIDGRAALVQDGRWVDVETATGGAVGCDPMAALTRLDALAGVTVPADAPALDPARLGPPVPRPSKILAAALNYRKHAEESGLPIPARPALFARLPSALCGPADDVVLPAGRDQVDWEAEIVVVIGQRARHVVAADAWSIVAGVTCGQDISDRPAQFDGPSQFSLAKSHDTFAPLGPVLSTLDELADRDDLGITLRLNGELLQDGRSSDLIFDVPALIAAASAVCTLEPGDLLFTGTPAGVGFGLDPQRFLVPGDVIETQLEGVGMLRNRCVSA